MYLLTAIRLTPGGSSTAHIYTQTIHRTTQLTNWEEFRPCPVFASHTLAFALQLRKKHGKTPQFWGKDLCLVLKSCINYIYVCVCMEEGGMHRFVTTKQGHVQLTAHFRAPQNYKGSLTWRTQICTKWQNGCLSQFLPASECLHDACAACQRGCRLFSASKASKISWKSKK